jgi:hypothetical protein
VRGRFPRTAMEGLMDVVEWWKDRVG